jgi:hypothetical protein
MVTSTLRCLGGFLLANFVWGAVEASFVITPDELIVADADRLNAAVLLALLAAVHSLVLTAPFVFVGAIYAEQRAIRGLLAYVGVAIAFAAAVYLIRFYAAGSSQPLYVAGYVLAANLTAAAAAGLTYWAIAGRRAGGVRANSAETSHPAAAKLAQKKIS